MHTEMHESSPFSTVSRLSSARLRPIILAYGIVPVLVCVMLVMIFTPQLPWSQASIGFKICLILVLLVVVTRSLLFFLDRLCLRLVTSPEGISYKSLGYRLFTPWENVAGLAVRTVVTEMRGSKRQISGLMLRFPAPGITVHFWARHLLGWLDASSTFIPISDFAGYGGELSQEIQRYVPALGM